jgi:hypothetical protein
MIDSSVRVPGLGETRGAGASGVVAHAANPDKSAAQASRTAPALAAGLNLPGVHKRPNFIASLPF